MEALVCLYRMEFYVVCTNAETGEPIYHNCPKGDAEDVQWMRASAAMPFLSKMVELDGYKLSDGGTADSIPIKYFQSIGYERNVIILTQPLGFVKKKNSQLPFLRIVLRKYPNLIKALETRHVMYNDTLKYIEEQEKEGKVLVVRPSRALEVGPVEKNPDNLEKVYQIGRSDGEKAIKEIKNFLSVNKRK